MGDLAIASVFAFAHLQKLARANNSQNTNQPPNHTYTCVSSRLFFLFMETRKCNFLEMNRIKEFSDEEKERQKQDALEKILKNKETTVYFKMEEILTLFEQL